MVLSAKKIQSSKEKNKTEIRLAAIVMGIIGLVSYSFYYADVALLMLLMMYAYKYGVYFLVYFMKLSKSFFTVNFKALQTNSCDVNFASISYDFNIPENLQNKVIRNFFCTVFLYFLSVPMTYELKLFWKLFLVPLTSSTNFAFLTHER